MTRPSATFPSVARTLRALPIRVGVLVGLALAVLLPGAWWLEQSLTDRLTESRLADLRGTLESGMLAMEARVTLAETRVDRLAHAVGEGAERADAIDAAEFRRTTRTGLDGVIRVAPPISPSNEAVFWIPPSHPLDPFWQGMLARARTTVGQLGLGIAGESSEDAWFLTPQGAEIVYMPTDPDYANRAPTGDYDASYWLEPVRAERNPIRSHIWLPIQRSPRPPLWYAAVIAPVYARDRFLGAVGIDISIGHLVEQAIRLPTGPGYGSLVLRTDGLISYGAGAQFARALRDSMTIRDLPSPLRDSLQALLVRARAGGPGSVSRSAVGPRVMLASSLGGLDWTVVTVIEKAVVAAPLASPLRLMRLVLATVLLLLLAALIAVVAADARRRRGIDEQRARAMARFNQLFELTPVAVALTRLRTGEVIEVNRAACQLAELSREALLGRTTSELGLWGGADEQAQVRDTLQREGVMADHATTFRTGAGRVLEVRLAARVIEVEGEPHVLTVVQDLSAQRELEARLLHAHKLEAVGRLAGGVAHDFNNLLTAVIGYAQLLYESMAEADERREDVSEILTAAERGATLVRQLLGFARQQSVTPRVVDVIGVVTGLQGMLRTLIGAEIEVITELDSVGGTVKIDPGQLEQVLTNLAVNARDAMPRGGTLTFRTHTEGAEVLLDVSDTGGGIPEAVRAHIFEPFYTTKEVGAGTGLGLATCYGIMQQAGGSIECLTTSSRGTTFQLRLPLVAASTTLPDAPVPLPLPPSNRGSACIMLVEDNAMVRGVTTTMLKGQGYRVLACEGPSTALTYLLEADDEVDLVISDIRMPQMSGPAFGRVLATTHPAMPMLFISGQNPEEEIRRDLSLLGHPFLPKPFSRAELLQAVAEGLVAR